MCKIFCNFFQFFKSIWWVLCCWMFPQNRNFGTAIAVQNVRGIHVWNFVWCPPEPKFWLRFCLAPPPNIWVQETPCLLAIFYLQLNAFELAVALIAAKLAEGKLTKAVVETKGLGETRINSKSWCAGAGASQHSELHCYVCHYCHRTSFNYTGTYVLFCITLKRYIMYEIYFNFVNTVLEYCKISWFNWNTRIE